MEGYSGYKVDVESGTVFSYKSNKYIGSVDKNKGYIHITLVDDDGKHQKWLLHRFIYTYANGEIPKGMTVNHIDEDKSNNSLSNLNLLTVAEQNVWGTRIDRFKQTLKNKRYDVS